MRHHFCEEVVPPPKPAEEERTCMGTIGYHQRLAVLAHERGDYLSAAQHYLDAANCYRTPEQAQPCLKLAAEEELAHKEAVQCVLVPA